MAHILIVEGETVSAADLRAAIDTMDHAVVGVAGDGGEALRLAATRSPGLVLIDLRLRGDMDSLALARQLRERSGPPVVFLADESDPELLERSLAAEAFGYVRVPFSAAFLRCTIGVALHRHVVETALDDQERELGDALARLDAMLSVADGGIAIEDEAGRIWRASPRLCAIFGITAAPAQLLGMEAAELRRRIAPCFADPEGFAARAHEIVHARKPVLRERWELADGREVEFNFVPYFVGERFLGQFWGYRYALERDEKPDTKARSR